MFPNFSALSVGAMCTAGGNIMDVLWSQFLQFFGLSSTAFFAGLCRFIDFSTIVRPS